jgi:hypothetical protein
MLKLRQFSVRFVAPAALAQTAGCGGGEDGDPDHFIRSAST